MGIDVYNEECRSIVMRYASEWEAIVKRVGRWIDFKNDYKTLDASYMESVWWVFKQLFDKGLVYRGFKVTNSLEKKSRVYVSSKLNNGDRRHHSQYVLMNSTWLHFWIKF